MHFDWYQATVPAAPEAVLAAMGQSLGAVDQSDGPGRLGYESSARLLGEDGETLVEVQHGGNGDKPNARASGVHAPAFADALRRHFPVHAVTRVDVCEDFQGVQSYDDLEALCREVTLHAGIKGRAIVPDDPADGRTYYMGSPKSPVSARLYDKTAERRAKLPAGAHLDVPEGWSRLEVQVRPRRRQREGIAMCPPQAIWGASRWSQHLAAQVLHLDIERIPNPSPPPTSDLTSLGHMLDQYGQLLTRIDDRNGSAFLWRRIEERMTQIREKGR